MLRVRGNAAEVPGDYVPLLAFVAARSPGEQSIKAQNRLGGSAEARGRASGSSWSATLDCYWGSSTSTGCSRRVDGTTRYLLDGLSVIAQYAPDGARQAWYTQSLARIDEVLNVVSDGGKQWYQADALGSIYGLTNNSGVLIGNQNYDVFGAPTPAPSGPAGQPFGFTGREHELDSGLVYARARYLNPSTGTWTREDPFTASVALSGGFKAEPWLTRVGAGAVVPALGASRYQYTVSPATLTDPTGLYVVYAGMNATAAAGTGTTYAVGGVFGSGERGFSFALALTEGLALQLGPSLNQLLNVSVSAEFGIYWGLKDACAYAGPFVSLSADFGEFGATLVWSVTWSAIQNWRATGFMPALAAALGPPVGLSLSASIPIKMPNAGITLSITHSWLFNTLNCDCT